MAAATVRMIVAAVVIAARYAGMLIPALGFTAFVAQRRKNHGCHGINLGPHRDTKSTGRHGSLPLRKNAAL